MRRRGSTKTQGISSVRRSASGFKDEEMRKHGLVTVGVLLLGGLVTVGGVMWCSAEGARERAGRVGVSGLVVGDGGNGWSVSGKRPSSAASPLRGAATEVFEIQTSAGADR